MRRQRRKARVAQRTKIDGILVDPARIRPSYLPILRAHYVCIDAGKPPTCVNIAKELRRSKQSVSQLFLRRPDLMAWVNRQAEAHAQHYTGLIIRRHAMLAMQGSTQSAELVLKHQGGAYTARAYAEDGDGKPALGAGGFVMNFLVPRPGTPVIPGVTVREVQPPQLPKSADAESGHIACSPESASIPVVKIR